MKTACILFIFISLVFALYVSVTAAGERATDDAGSAGLISAPPVEKEGGRDEDVRQPDIFVEMPNHDFGKIYRGARVEHIFRIENRGDATLNIKKAHSSCGCTATIIKSKDIPAGGSGEVKVTFNSQAYKGSVTKNITVLSDDADTPKYKLAVSCTVIEEVNVTPRRIDLAKIPFKSGASWDINVASVTSRKLEIERVESSSPDITLTVKDGADENGYVVKAVLGKDAGYGKVTGNIYIYTNSERQKKITIPFYGEVIGDVSVYPPRISCGIIDVDREVVYPAFLIIYNEAVDIEQVASTLEFIETAVTEVKGRRKTYKIESIVRKGAPAGKFTGVLKIYTTSKEQPVVEIPVTGMIKG